MLNFPIHERHSTVVHLRVHLENGHRVYFHEEKVRVRTLVPQDTTLIAFFNPYQDDEFAKTLFYQQVPKYYTWNVGSKKCAHRKAGQTVPDSQATKPVMHLAMCTMSILIILNTFT